MSKLRAVGNPPPPSWRWGFEGFLTLPFRGVLLLISDSDLTSSWLLSFVMRFLLRPWSLRIPAPDAVACVGEQVAGMVFSVNVLFPWKILAVRYGQQM